MNWRPKAETEVGSRVAAWLTDMRWAVYPEVGPLGADIIATLDIGLSIPRVWGIECKRQLSWKLIDQAEHLLGFTLRQSIAIPRRPIPRAVRAACQHLGIGILRVGCDGAVDEYLMPRRISRRRHRPLALDYLRPEMRGYTTPGRPGSAGWSPFKSVCERLCNIVRLEPGMTLKDAVAKLDGHHHYRSDKTAVRSLAAWLRQGVVHGIDGRIEKGKYRLFLKETR